jgi:hypothetical protein
VPALPAGLPGVEGGPDPLHAPETPPGAPSLPWGPPATTQEQGASLLGLSGGKNPAQNRQGLPMDLKPGWREREHEG